MEGSTGAVWVLFTIYSVFYTNILHFPPTTSLENPGVAVWHDPCALSRRQLLKDYFHGYFFPSRRYREFQPQRAPRSCRRSREDHPPHYSGNGRYPRRGALAGGAPDRREKGDRAASRRA